MSANAPVLIGAIGEPIAMGLIQKTNHALVTHVFIDTFSPRSNDPNSPVCERVLSRCVGIPTTHSFFDGLFLTRCPVAVHEIALPGYAALYALTSLGNVN